MFDPNSFSFDENDLLVITDMQEDFRNGPLGTKRAKDITPGIAELVKTFPGTKVWTKDTHQADYLNTQEGRNLPVEHTIENTPGWEIVPELKALITDNDIIITKPGFGSRKLHEFIRKNSFERIFFVGVCTGICVISNVIVAKTADTEAKVYVIADLCGCVTKQSHDTALEAMKLLQVSII